jgi:multidrug efflux pump subunit AcrA (membrane-fusion protein)
MKINRLNNQVQIYLLLSAGLAAFFVLFLGACKKEAQQVRKGGNRPQAFRIQTTSLQRITIQRQVDLAGTLVSPDQARVSSEVAGVVQQVLVELGQKVAVGQPLVRLEPRELELALRRAESLLRQTEAQLGMDGTKVKEPPPDDQIASIRTAMANRDDAHAQLARAKRLRNQNLLSQADLDTAETRVKVTEAAYQSALENIQSLKASLQERRAALELAQKKLNDAIIRAPVSGSVSERLVQPGEFIRENTPVIAVVQMNPLKLRTAVQERHASLIRAGLEVQFRVESFPDETFRGRVAYVSPAVDQATRTFAVEVLVDNRDERLKPGFFAKGIIMTRRDEAVLAAPEEAISTLAGMSNVFVVENNKVRQQPITLVAREGKYTEILSGLKGHEVVAASNLSQLATGMQVEIAPLKDASSPKTGLVDDQGARGEQGGRP